MEKTLRVYFPRWATLLYGGMAIILIPWTVNLAASLPSRHIEDHWDAAWVGFDLIMLCAIALTLWFMIRRQVWVVISASALATLMLIDMWFDILTAKPGHELRMAMLFGVIECALALLTFRLVYLVIHHAAPEKKFKLHINSKV